jgi:flavin reductase (DIM6/NTAB) family NADH-FMN oxidoreductase RutF
MSEVDPAGGMKEFVSAGDVRRHMRHGVRTVSAVPGYSPADFRRVMSSFPTGVTAVAACMSGRPLGMTASSFTSVSLEPPIVSVCIGHSSTTWPQLRSAERLGISVLGAHQEEASRRLSVRHDDRFEGLAWHARANGAVLLTGACAWLECSVEREVAVGDHDVVLLRVHALGSDPELLPLVVHGSRYRRLVPEGSS